MNKPQYNIGDLVIVNFKGSSLIDLYKQVKIKEIHSYNGVDWIYSDGSNEFKDDNVEKDDDVETELPF